MTKKQLPLIALTLIALAFVSTGYADDEADPATQRKVSFFSDIRPIFQLHCNGCHQPAKQGGEYVMPSFDRLSKGGESGEQAIIPGDAASSHLIQMITPIDGQAEMPKGKKPMSDSEIEMITNWINQGAENDSPASARPAFSVENPPKYTAPPVLTSLDFSPDGKFLAISGYHEVLLHNADGSGIAHRLIGLSERIESARFSPDGTRLAVSGGSPARMGEIQVWNVAETTLQFTVPAGYDTVYGANWSPDGKMIAYGMPDNTVRAINAESGEQILFNGAHNDWVLDTVFSTKSDHLITVSRDRSMKLIKVDTQRFIDNITSITPGALKGGLNAVDCHPERDELLCGGADGTPKIYRMIREKARRIGDDFNLIRAFPSMPGRIFSVVYSPDGNRIAAGSSLNGSGQVQVYNYEDAKVISTVDIPGGGIYSVAIHPDNKTVAAAGFDGFVYLINSDSGEITKKFLPVEITTEVAAAKK